MSGNKFIVLFLLFHKQTKCATTQFIVMVQLNLNVAKTASK